jgi:hypothetical protein
MFLSGEGVYWKVCRLKKILEIPIAGQNIILFM